MALRLIVELEKSKMKIKSGSSSIVVPRQYYRGLYDAMIESATNIADDEILVVELKPKEKAS